jgi:hypothetical protein
MEWKRVKTVLIALLLVTNLVLGYNYYRQRRMETTSRLAAAENALRVAGESLNLSAEDVLALPTGLFAWTATRDTDGEDTLAAGLLGQPLTIDNAGGGIVRYSGPGGTGQVKNGGEMVFDLTDPPENTAAGWRARLTAGGLTAPERAFAAAADGFAPAQTWQGLPLLPAEQYTLLCVADDAGGGSVSGRWLLLQNAAPDVAAAGTPELLLRLAGHLTAAGYPAADGLTAGYFALSTPGWAVELHPCWRVSAGAQMLIFDLITQELLVG